MSTFINNEYHLRSNQIYCRMPFFVDHNFADFVNFLFYMKIISLKYNIYVRIHCDLEVLHRFIVIYRINMVLLKYVSQEDYSYCLTWRVLCLTLCHHLQLLQQIVKDLVNVVRPTIFISHGYSTRQHMLTDAS